MKKTLILGVLLLLLYSCATMFEDVRIYKAEEQGLLRLGIHYRKVVEIVGREPNIAADYYKKETRPDGEHFIWIVNGRNGVGNLMRTYKFEFKNWYLSSWSVQ